MRLRPPTALSVSEISAIPVSEQPKMSSAQALREVIEELHAERAEHENEIKELDVVIGRLEARLRKVIRRADLPAPTPGRDETEDMAKKEGPFADMTNPEAALAYLQSVEGARTTKQIRKAMLAGGVTTDAKNFHSTVYTTLRRLADDGKIEDLGGGKWAVGDGWLL